MPELNGNMKLVLLWKGNGERRLIHSRISYPLESLKITKCELERLGVEILGACEKKDIPPNALPWRLGDPGTDFYLGIPFRGDLKALWEAVEQIQRDGGRVVHGKTR